MHWINRLHRSFILKTSSSTSFKIIASKIGIKSAIFNPTFSLVFWKRDTIHQWVLNCNGSSKDNMASGGVIRNPVGVHYSNHFEFFRLGSSIFSELLALLRGLELCVQLIIFDVQVKNYSKLVVGQLKSSLSIPWNIRIWWRITTIIIHTVMKAIKQQTIYLRWA